MTVGASRNQLIWSPVVGWVLLSCAATAVHAQVETPTPARQTLDQQTPQVDLPEILSLPASSGGGGASTSNELGVSVGAFTLFPTLELDVGYDSNVFAEPSTARLTPSALAVIRPSLSLQSEWLNHSLRILANGGFGYYANAPTQNFENYNLQADGRLDIAYDFYLTGSVGIRRSTEALGTPNVSFAQAPTVVHTVPVRVSLYQKFNRLFYEISASATRYRYYDYSTITSLGLPGSSRNRTEYEESLRIGYEVVDGVSLWVSPALSQIKYAEVVNTAGQQRDQTGWRVQLGSTVRLGSKTSLDGFIGQMSDTILADGSTTTAFIYGLAGTLNIYEPLVVRPAISRGINQSALSNYQNYVSTTIGADFAYEIHGPWKAVGGLSYNTADYTPATSGVSPRTDYFVKASIGLLYDFRPQYSIGPVYEYNQGWSSDVAAGGPAFSRSLFSIRLVARR